MLSLDGWYCQLVTSYDTAAPVSEAGDTRELYRMYRAEQLMLKPTMTLSTSDSMSVVMDKFQDCDAGTLPVLRPDGQFVGFVSRTRLYASYRQIMKDYSEE